MSDDALRAYHAKRDFSKTTEPAGGTVSASRSGRLYAIQKHAARQLHYDLRLELDGVLLSWAVPKGPSLDPGVKPLAVRTEDHPIEYGSFEGIIPEGEYGGGTVMLWDEGTWAPLADPVEGLATGDFKFELFGEKLRGGWALVRMKGDDGRNWLLIKKQDAAARPIAVYNVIAELPFSVASGRTMEAIAADPGLVWRDGRAERVEGPSAVAALPDPSALTGAKAVSMPRTFPLQLAETSTRPPAGAGWVHEPKLDGYRLLAIRDEGGSVRLLTRNGHDWTDRLPNVARAFGRLPEGPLVVDGEVVVLDSAGMPDFGALQNAFRGGGGRAAFVYYVFDVLYAAGFDLRAVPLVERKQFLEDVVASAPSVAPTIQACEHFEADGDVVFAHAAKLGLEGIISKRGDASYVGRRTDAWLKVKAKLRQELVVGGYTDPAGGRAGFGALLLGYYDGKGRLVYCGRVGTGFDERTLDAIYTDLTPLSRETSPFVNPEKDPDATRAHWVEPSLVAEVEFTAWTRDGLLRHAAFLGLREDRDAPDVVLETAPHRTRRGHVPEANAATPVVEAAPRRDDGLVAGVRISHPDRTVYPEARVTKREVAEYYEAVAEWMLPHVVKRPLSIVRCPLGLAGEAFYQRHVATGFPPSIRGVVHGTEIEGEPYIVIDDLAGLVSLVQMGVLEVHAWGCREDEIEKPDTLVFDLDPGPGITWPDIVASAQFVRDYLGDLGLTSFVKTTGGKGAHVVVPIVRRSTWADAAAFSRDVAAALARLAPRNFVTTMSKAFRENRIYIDYVRNTRGATAVAPYSTRARPGACVSTPLAWDEMDPGTPPGAYTVRTVPERLTAPAGDPWTGLRAVRQSITAKMKKAVRGG